MIVADERFTHEPVLLQETLERLVTDPSGRYLDATLGLGGHSEAILNKLSAQGRVLALDADPEALDRAGHRLASHSGRFRSVRSNFRALGSIIEKEGFKPLDGALFDLGVSSLQLDKAERGFSFLREGPLDMRLGPDAPLTAAQIVNRWPAGQIARLLTEYGEEPEAERIAAAIVARREKKPFETTLELAHAIEAVVPRTGHHPATRAFQALRIAVNQELDSLELALAAVVPLLKPGGRLCVISFHSLEDRIVKNAIASFVTQGTCAPLPKPYGKSPVSPSEAEVARNPRSRSAKLRAVEKRREGAQ